MILAWIIIGVLLSLLATLPFTYNWVSKRGQYLARLNSIGFRENDRGLITKLEGPAKPVEDFFSADPEENIGSSKNPGFIYTAAGTTMLLPNAIVGLFKYFVYKRRMQFQRRVYNQTQLDLLKQIENSDADCSHLKDAIIKEFFPS